MKKATTILIAICVVIAVAMLYALPTMLLWNWLMPSIFGLAKIGFLQAFGINLLCGILFKNSSQSNKD